MQPFELTIEHAAAAIAARTLSPVELVDSVLDRCDAVERRLHAYVTVVADRARQDARRAEKEILDGLHRGPLHGIPYGLKDLFDVSGIPTTASSRVWADRMPDGDSTVATRLAAAGAILIGKTHTHEFAYGLLTPQTANPWHADAIAGGSSGGSAVAVAAGSALFALGTDTGGSIRIPAALNGMVGLKPTYGLVSRHGVAPLAWSLDHVGPIARTVRDTATVLSALAGHDPADPASAAAPAHAPAPYPAGPRGLRGLRVGVPDTYYFDRVDPQVEAAVRETVELLRELGAAVTPVRLPLVEHMEATQWGLMAPEASAVHEETLRAAPHLYGPDIRLLLEAGSHVSALDYLRAQRTRSLISDAWIRLFGGVDVLIAPTSPITAARRGQETVRWPDGVTETVTDAYVRLSSPANITGFPALSLPVGTDSAGLPIGAQLIAAPFSESVLFRVGTVIEEQRTDTGGPADVPRTVAIHESSDS
ncbi:amidase [Streptomyces griseofuscus]|uniref:amidase n=1 Tax=Streptomyces TaxID=1883 RepID=UPI0018F0C70D|nr:amidase [Streptomyces sp. CRPSP2-6A1]MBJ7002563.1 amidase [Streptomyces sp. CRPSP2-6A1]